MGIDRTEALAVLRDLYELPDYAAISALDYAERHTESLVHTADGTVMVALWDDGTFELIDMLGEDE